MATVLHISIGVKSGDTGHDRGREFIVHDRTLAKNAIWTWLQTAIAELEAEAVPADREII